MINITLVIPTLNQPEKLRNTITDFYAGSRIPNRTIIVNNGIDPKTMEKIFSPEERVDRNIWIFQPPYNLGVSGSCNIAMALCSVWNSFWLHSNDDVQVDPAMLKLMETEMEEVVQDSSKLQFVFPEHGEGSLFTIFLANPFVLSQKVGLFDEQFFPAYFEDNDYARRMMLTGLVYRNMVMGAKYEHYTSSTVLSFSPEQKIKHDEQFGGNREKYISKWGGEPEHEQFTTPYGKIGEYDIARYPDDHGSGEPGGESGEGLNSTD